MLKVGLKQNAMTLQDLKVGQLQREFAKLVLKIIGTRGELQTILIVST